MRNIRLTRSSRTPIRAGHHVRSLALTASLLVTLASGCASIGSRATRHYVVSSEIVVERALETEQRAATAIASTNARSLTRASAVIAVRPPDDCLDQTAVVAEGLANQDDSLLHEVCSIAIAEMERALVRRGWRVLHWQAMEDYLASRRDATTPLPTPEEVAAMFGATVLLNVNSLDLGSAIPAAVLRWNLRYFRASIDGEPTDDARVDRQTAEALLRYMASREQDGVALGLFVENDPGRATLATSMPTVTLNVTAEDVGTRESLWFFAAHRVHTHDVAPSTVSVHVRCGRTATGAHRCEDVPARAESDEMTEFSASFVQSRSGGSASRVMWMALVRAVADELATSFGTTLEPAPVAQGAQ